MNESLVYDFYSEPKQLTSQYFVKKRDGKINRADGFPNRKRLRKEFVLSDEAANAMFTV